MNGEYSMETAKRTKYQTAKSVDGEYCKHFDRVCVGGLVTTVNCYFQLEQKNDCCFLCFLSTSSGRRATAICFIVDTENNRSIATYRVKCQQLITVITKTFHTRLFIYFSFRFVSRKLRIGSFEFVGSLTLLCT